MNGHASKPHTNGTTHPHPPTRLFSQTTKPDLTNLTNLCSRTTLVEDYPLASNIASKIPVYDLSHFSSTNHSIVIALQEEWYHILSSGPGVFILRSLEPNVSLLSSINKVFDDIITTESATKQAGDHFAPSGSNSRIWNSFQKHAIASPQTFTEYYSNPWLAHISSAWLGPAYQMTAQVNIVRPGGAAQLPHRDYHLGFQDVEAVAQWPRGMHHASQFLTLQGAVAHSDMPLDSGPTRLLPFSQLCEDGFMLWRTDAVKRYFAENWVSAELKMGDGLFFNPALFHAAGENVTGRNGEEGVQRSANLMQISSPFGRAMESVDTSTIIASCWDEVRALAKREGKESLKVQACLQAISEGYPFPTNLDRRPPAPGKMAPESETDLLIRALENDLSRDEVVAELQHMRAESAA